MVKSGLTQFHEYVDIAFGARHSPSASQLPPLHSLNFGDLTASESLFPALPSTAFGVSAEQESLRTEDSRPHQASRGGVIIL